MLVRLCVFKNVRMKVTLVTIFKEEAFGKPEEFMEIYD